MKLTDRDRQMIVLGLVVALGIVGWTYAAAPMQQRWKRVTQRLKAGHADLTKLQRVAQETRYYADRRERIAAMVIQTPNLEASQRVIPVLINEIEDCGHRRHITIARYDPLPPKVEENYAVYSLNLNFHSDLGATVEFLKDLRAARPVTNIKRLHITPPSATSKTQDLTVELLLSTYAIKHPGEPPETAKAGAASGA
jgi:Tfp pilus assembly protein PilO